MNTTQKTTAYIIDNNEVIAIVRTALKNGTTIEYSGVTAYNALTQKSQLVNAWRGKISRNKKYEKQAHAYDTDYAYCIEHNELDMLYPQFKLSIRHIKFIVFNAIRIISIIRMRLFFIFFGE